MLLSFKTDKLLPPLQLRQRDQFRKVTAKTRIFLEQCLGTLKPQIPCTKHQPSLRVSNGSKNIVACMGPHNIVTNLGPRYYEKAGFQNDPHVQNNPG